MFYHEKRKTDDVFLIKVFDYHNKNISGKVYDVYRNEYKDYKNMTQLLLNIDAALDKEIPQVMDKESIFNTVSQEGNFEMVVGKKVWLPGKLRIMRTFKLKMRFTKFNTWQGELWCMNSEEYNEFRSVLELMMLIDAELESSISSSMPRVIGGI